MDESQTPTLIDGICSLFRAQLEDEAYVMCVLDEWADWSRRCQGCGLINGYHTTQCQRESK